jgi:hypothetical protein
MTTPKWEDETMAIHQLSLKALEHLDMGKALEAFNLHVARVARDCMDRPGDSKPRTVTLKMGFTPVMQSDGNCDEVKAQIHVSSAVPTHRTKVYSFGLRRNGSLVFNEDSPDAIDQATMFEEDEDR